MGRLLGLLLAVGPLTAQAEQIAEGCDVDGDGRVDGYDPATWDEQQQQANLLNFFGVTMGYSPLQSPAPLKAFQVTPRLELSYVPQLRCIELAVFDATKTENANKTYAFPRLRVTIGLPLGFYLGLSGIPPVEVFGVQTGIIGAELGYGAILKDRIEVGGRAHILGGRVAGDLAGPLGDQPAVDDVYRNTIYGIEANAGYRIQTKKALLVPYVGAGYTRVIALMYAGESLPEDYDETDPNQASTPGYGDDEVAQALYRGPAFQVGVHTHIDRLNVVAEAYAVPLSFRLFLSPRVLVGYTFF